MNRITEKLGGGWTGELRIWSLTSFVPAFFGWTFLCSSVRRFLNPSIFRKSGQVRIPCVPGCHSSIFRTEDDDDDWVWLSYQWSVNKFEWLVKVCWCCGIIFNLQFLIYNYQSEMMNPETGTMRWGEKRELRWTDGPNDRFANWLIKSSIANRSIGLS